MSYAGEIRSSELVCQYETKRKWPVLKTYKKGVEDIEGGEDKGRGWEQYGRFLEIWGIDDGALLQFALDAATMSWSLHPLNGDRLRLSGGEGEVDAHMMLHDKEGGAMRKEGEEMWGWSIWKRINELVILGHLEGLEGVGQSWRWWVRYRDRGR